LLLVGRERGVVIAVDALLWRLERVLMLFRDSHDEFGVVEHDENLEIGVMWISCSEIRMASFFSGEQYSR